MSVIFDNLGSPWAGIGKDVGGAESVTDAMQKAGLDWTVSKDSMFLADGREVTQKAVVRSDTKDVLGYVTPKWTPYQNADAFKWFEPFVEANEVEFSTAGAFKQGRITWILARLNRDNSEIAAGDEVEKYLLLSNSHDGKLAVRVGFTPIRIVCTNTLHAAHRSSSSRLLRVNHGSQVRQNVEYIRDVVNMANQDFEATAEQYRYLASKGINSEDLDKYIKIVLGIGEKSADEMTTRSKNIVSSIEDLFEGGRGSDIAGVRGTYWGAYNAVTEYLNYSKGRTANNRMDSVWFGQNGTMNQKALDTALELSA